jgi:hypothetical protein
VTRNGSSSGGRHGERRQTTSGGARGAERRPGDRKGNPLKGEPQERRRYETRPAGYRGERSVTRPRKPEDAAQPGQASPVQVAPRHLMRCRGEEPQESVSVPIHRLVRPETADSPARVILWSRAKPRRGSRTDSSSMRDRGPRKDLEGRPREGRRSRRSRQPMGRYRGPWKDSVGHVNCTRGGARRGDRADAARAGPRTLEGTSESHVSLSLEGGPAKLSHPERNWRTT